MDYRDPTTVVLPDPPPGWHWNRTVSGWLLSPFDGPPEGEVRPLMLHLDEDDYATVQAEFARRQLVRWPAGNTSPGLVTPDGPPKSGVLLPDGDSNLAGAMVAEAFRALDEYREMFDAWRAD